MRGKPQRKFIVLKFCHRTSPSRSSTDLLSRLLLERNIDLSNSPIQLTPQQLRQDFDSKIHSNQTSNGIRDVASTFVDICLILPLDAYDDSMFESKTQLWSKSRNGSPATALRLSNGYGTWNSCMVLDYDESKVCGLKNNN